ncbi:MAG: phosphatidate cytidylyltransferase [Trichlorobacter sp.]|jgi:phosphatidate cytidylyltransferase
MQRLITALVLLPLLLWVILAGTPWMFALLLVLLTGIGLYEFYQMAFKENAAQFLPFCLVGALVPLLPLVAAPPLMVLALTLLFLAGALHLLFRFRDISQAASDVGLLALSILYVPLLMSHLQLIRQLENGVSWLLLIMLIVMTNDSAAYYTGCRFGKHRLYEAVSPKKSIEGSLGGLVGSLIGTALAKATFFPQLQITDLILAPLLIGSIGQLGDLFESLLKRSFGVKDSGTIFPGHGGVLDRLDSIIFAAPVTYYYAVLLFGRWPL